MLNIHREFNDLRVDIDLEDCIYINQGFSASGKTFLMQLLLDYANVNNKSVCLYDYHNISNVEALLNSSDASVILLFDNADLYLNETIVKKILTQKAPVLINSRYKYKNLFDTDDDKIKICGTYFDSSRLCLEVYK